MVCDWLRRVSNEVCSRYDCCIRPEWRPVAWRAAMRARSGFLFLPRIDSLRGRRVGREGGREAGELRLGIGGGNTHNHLRGWRGGVSVTRIQSSSMRTHAISNRPPEPKCPSKSQITQASHTNKRVDPSLHHPSIHSQHPSKSNEREKRGARSKGPHERARGARDRADDNRLSHRGACGREGTERGGERTTAVHHSEL